MPVNLKAPPRNTGSGAFRRVTGRRNQILESVSVTQSSKTPDNNTEETNQRRPELKR